MKRLKSLRFRKHKELVRRAIAEMRKRHVEKIAYWNEKMREAAERKEKKE